MKYIVILISITALMMSCTNNENMKTELFDSHFGEYGDSVTFKFEYVYLEDLNSFTQTVEKSMVRGSTGDLVDLYRSALDKLNKSIINSDYADELKELCETTIIDVQNSDNHSRADFFMVWDDLRLLYSTSESLDSLSNYIGIVTLPKSEYLRLVAYTSEMLEHVHRENGTIYCYQVLTKQNGKTKIKFFEMIE